jgi:hypothetical protein
MSAGGTATIEGGAHPYYTPPILDQWPIYLDYNQGSPTAPDWIISQGLNTDNVGDYRFYLPSNAPYGQYRVRPVTFSGTIFDGIYNQKPFRFTYAPGSCTDYVVNWTYDFLYY